MSPAIPPHTRMHVPTGSPTAGRGSSPVGAGGPVVQSQASSRTPTDGTHVASPEQIASGP